MTHEKELLLDVISHQQLEMSSSDAHEEWFVYSDDRIEQMLQLTKFVLAVLSTELLAVQVKPINKEFGYIKYLNWFKPFTKVFDELLLTNRDFFKDFELCAEIKCFFSALDEMYQFPSLHGLFENSRTPQRLSYLNARIKVLNDFISILRTEFAKKEVQEEIKYREKKSVKNFASCRLLINKLFKRYSKLLVIRVDLAIKPSKADLINHDLIDLTNDFHLSHQLVYLKQCIIKLLQNQRNNSELNKILGYIFKFEHGIKKGFHVHAIFFFMNGNIYQNDQFYAAFIANYWKKITGGKGCTYNCHMAKSKYKKLGIGIIEYHDHEKRGNLITCIKYLCKSEQFFLFKPLHAFNYKTLQKSNGPKLESNHSGVGRPRKYNEVGAVLDAK